ncbi:outer membrane protein [Legionella sp. km772]|uniref:outer membrane protein n=1 Tax=Legionella sp. km772 TaxID=2498111 RepID=UPI000F8ECDE1|nr:outer membrane beta-barrel protein [Legionella sp. km772]RUR05420.1 hypothetical protein ELY15_14345 [Legionella sp. km772]
MINKKFDYFSIFFLGLFLLDNVSAQDVVKTHAPYIGIIGGYGSTTWDGLVPSSRNQNVAMSMSTPIEVKEGGGVWGFLAGYEFSPYFAIEANYLRYPDAEVAFDALSLFTFNHDGVTKFTSSTESLSIMGKIMLIIPDTKIRAYSGAGIANLHREDMIVDDWRVSPTFGVGFIYPISEHLMGSLSGEYTAGFGESQLNPADTYYPFLYSATVRLAYRF